VNKSQNAYSRIASLQAAQIARSPQQPFLGKPVDCAITAIGF
jgi:hypothetical protein